MTNLLGSFIGHAVPLPSPSRISFADTSNRFHRRNRSSVSQAGGRGYGLFVNTERALYDAYTSNSNYPNTPKTSSTLSPIRKDLSVFTSDNVSTGTTLVSPYNSAYLPITPQFNATTTDGKLGTFSAINIILGKTVGVAIYSVPSSIFNSVGSVGMSILLWVVGALISYCGLAVYLDLGSAIPRSGGERVYLECIFKKPRMLATCIFMAYVVLLGFSTPNCIVLGEYAMYALEIEANRWNVRIIAVAVVTLLCVIHARYQKLGLRIINVLGVFKMVILAIVIVSGVAGAFMGVGSSTSLLTRRRLAGMDSFDLVSNAHLGTARRNFSNMFEGSSTQPYDYAHALLKILYCFRGYSAVNSVLNEVRNPIPTLRIAAPVALSLVSVGYILANIAYFLVVSKEDFRSSGVVIAGHFFKNIFGEIIGENVLPLFIMISAFGNIAATSFAQARVNQELGKDGLLPFSGFFAGKSRWNGHTPGLFLHWLVSVIVIVVPPPGEIYNFLVDIGGYPVSVLSVVISLGLLYLQSSPSEHWQSPFRAKKIYTIIFAASNMLLLVLPWIKPAESKGDGRFPYYAYPATALAILGSGAIYWCWWAGFKQRETGMMEKGWNMGLKTPLSDCGFPVKHNVPLLAEAIPEIR